MSEPDRGQSDAINKGIRTATGDIANWINSDDLFLKEGLRAVASAWHEFPNAMVVGSGIDFDEKTGNETLLFPRKMAIQNIIRFWEGWFGWLQPSIFFPRSVFSQVGGLEENFHLVMDIDLYCRLMQVIPVVYSTEPISKFRRHSVAKTQARYHDMMLEYITAVSKHKSHLEKPDYDQYDSHVILFLLRRTKRLLLDGHYALSSKYLFKALHRSWFSTAVLLFKLIFLKSTLAQEEFNSGR